MRANELRIGNLLLCRGAVSEVLEVYECHIKTKKEAKIPMRIVQGIPLTEGWLLRFGFELINNDYWQSRNLELKLHWTVNKNKMIPEFCEKRLITRYNFQHVHTLQNLYFALTGEELTLKQ